MGMINGNDFKQVFKNVDFLLHPDPNNINENSM